MSTLPPEIIEEIIGFVDSNWRSRLWDLRRCSLVCKTWQCIAQRPLFRRIELSLYKDVARENQTLHRAIRFRSHQACEALAHSLNQTLEKSPHLQSHIRQLHLEHFPIEACPPALFQRFHNLDSLKVRGLHWRNLSAEHRTALAALCTPLSDLAIEDANFASYSHLFYLLSQARSLRSLKLSQVRDINNHLKETPGNLQLTPVSNPPAHLDRLHLDCSSSSLIPFLVHPRISSLVIDVTQVRQLLSSRSAVFLDVATVLLPAIASYDTLQDVELCVYLADKVAPPLLPTSLHSVRNLHLTAQDPKAMAGSWLVSLFSGFVSPVLLEHITVDIELSDDPSEDYWEYWADLDDILTNHPFRRLRTMTLVIFLSDELSFIAEDEMACSLKKRLPRLHSLGIFKLQLRS